MSLIRLNLGKGYDMIKPTLVGVGKSKLLHCEKR